MSWNRCVVISCSPAMVNMARAAAMTPAANAGLRKIHRLAVPSAPSSRVRVGSAV
jgi:hypothetical protein